VVGTALDVIDGGSIWLLSVDAGDRVVDQPIEPRYLADIIMGEGLRAPEDLVGREVELAEDGMSMTFI